MNITKHRNIWFTISGALLLGSIACISIFGFNLGLDFTGGVRWTVGLQDSTNKIAATEDVQTFFLEQRNEKGRIEKLPKIQKTTNDEFLITIETVTDEVFEQIKADLAIEYTIEDKSFRRVDSAIGQSFKQKAFYAVFASLIGIVLFIAWAFRKIPKAVSPWRFSMVAILALVHDVVILLGVFTVLGAVLSVELDLQFITALLATLGFSVNDTIVILDRVRENLRKQKPTEDFGDTVEKSIQQTLTRSVNTSVSTLLPLFALLFYGADAIFYFILSLTIAIIVGTYSSIFLAAPMLVSLKKLAEK